MRVSIRRLFWVEAGLAMITGILAFITADRPGLDRVRIGLGSGSGPWVGRVVDRRRAVPCHGRAGRGGKERMATDLDRRFGA